MTDRRFLDPAQSVASMVNQNTFSRLDAVTQFIENLHRVPQVHSWVQDIENLEETLNLGKFNEANEISRDLPLNGLLIGIKDNIATREFPTAMGTTSWKGTPGAFDARIVATLRSKGAIIAGKTRCSEYALHQTTGTINPRYIQMEPGTSSSGSAAAVANGEVSVCLGTQTAGSIIKPASYCGIVGFKPSFGDFPRTGILKTTELFDTVGLLGRRVSDLTYVYEHLRVSGKDHPIHLRKRSLYKDRHFDRIFLMTGAGIDMPSNLLHSGLLELSYELSKNYNISKPEDLKFDFGQLRTCFFNVYYRDVAYFIRDHLTPLSISSELLQILEFGLALDQETYQFSKEMISSWQSFVENMPGNPLFVSLSTSSGAPKIGEKDPMDANLFITSAGLPQISVPLLRDNLGQLVGVSFSSKRFSDDVLLDFVSQLFPIDSLTIASLP